MENKQFAVGLDIGTTKIVAMDEDKKINLTRLNHQVESLRV